MQTVMRLLRRAQNVLGNERAIMNAQVLLDERRRDDRIIDHLVAHIGAPAEAARAA